VTKEGGITAEKPCLSIDRLQLPWPGTATGSIETLLSVDRQQQSPSIVGLVVTRDSSLANWYDMLIRLPTRPTTCHYR
jgi:hypothetical protein